MNWNGFYALDFAGTGYAEFPWSVSGTNGFTIIIRCLTDCKEDSGTLLSLDQVFSAGLEKGYLCIEAGQTCIQAKERVPVRCWNKFTVAYDGTVIKAYCNNILLVETEAAISYEDARNLRAGQGFRDSYIQRIAQYDRCLAENEILAKLFQKKDNGAVWKADFGADTFERSNYRQEWLHGCCVKNLVYTLDCSEGKLAADMPIQLRPEYSILCTCCFWEIGQAEKNVGKILSLPGLELSIREGDEEGYVFLSVSGGETPIEVYVRWGETLWMDLALISRADHLTLYMNGIQIGRANRGYPVCSGKVEFGKFSGYIDSCAVVDRAVTEEEIQKCRNCPPHVFDKDMRYLFCFADSIEKECCRGLLLVAEGSQVVLAKETGARVHPTGADAPGPARREKEYSKFAKWQVETVLWLLVEWIANWVGKYPNRGVCKKDGKLEIEEGLYAFTYREIVILPEAQELLANYDNLTEKLLLDLIYKMKETGALGKLLGYLYQEDEDWDSAAPLILALLLCAGIFLKPLTPALSAAIKAVPQNRPPEPPEDSDDDDDDDDDEKKKKKTYLSICQTNIKGNVEIDFGVEKEGEKGKNRAAIYWEEGENSIKLAVEISCKGEGGEFVIKAGSSSGSILKSAKDTRTLVAGQKTSVELTVSLRRTGRKYGKWKETVHWSSEAKDLQEGIQKKFLRDVEYEIHILEGKPCEPWEGKVGIECLELCAACAEYVGGDSQGFREDYAHWLRESSLEIASLEDPARSGATERAVTGKAKRKSYSRLPEGRTQKKAAFDAIRFSKDFPKNRGEIPAADLAYSYTLFCRLQGQQMNSIVLATGLKGSFLLESEKKLPLRRIHYVNMDESDGIYDYALDSYRLPFSDDLRRDMVGRKNSGFYRENNYVYGSYCTILATIPAWQLESLPEEGGIPVWEYISDLTELFSDRNYGAVIRGENDRYILSSRDEWTQETKNRFPKGDGWKTSICHSISTNNIDRAVASLLNAYKDQRMIYGILVERMGCLKEALWPDDYPNQREEDGLVKGGMENLISKLCLNVRRENYENIDEFLSHLGCSMCNAPWNLRIGNSSWNSSIRERFDPSQWFYYGEEGISSDESQIGIMKNSENYYGEKNFDRIPMPQEYGFYLPNIQDGIRIHNFKNAHVDQDVMLEIVQRLRIDKYGENLWQAYPLIYSSSNEFLLHELGDGRGSSAFLECAIFYLVRQDVGFIWARFN